MFLGFCTLRRCAAECFYHSMTSAIPSRNTQAGVILTGAVLGPRKRPRLWGRRGKDPLSHSPRVTKRARPADARRFALEITVDSGTQPYDFRRSHPASSAEPSSAVIEKNPHTAISLIRLVRCSSSIRVSATHHTGGPTIKNTTSVAASAIARTRFRPALCSWITPADATTTRRVRSAVARSRSAPNPLMALTSWPRADGSVAGPGAVTQPPGDAPARVPDMA